jgi:hypothetical protein
MIFNLQPKNRLYCTPRFKVFSTIVGRQTVVAIYECINEKFNQVGYAVSDNQAKPSAVLRAARLPAARDQPPLDAAMIANLREAQTAFQAIIDDIPEGYYDESAHARIMVMRLEEWRDRYIGSFPDHIIALQVALVDESIRLFRSIGYPN